MVDIDPRLLVVMILALLTWQAGVGIVHGVKHVAHTTACHLHLAHCDHKEVKK